MNKLTIEIAVSCTWFQKRLCWMMSSILQQEGDVPNIIFNVACPINNGNPNTETVCDFFRQKGLNIKDTIYNDEIGIQRRGIVRNRQLQETKCDWMLFSDSDMVYHPLFFYDLKNKLLNEYKNCDKCIASSRISLGKDYCKKYFNHKDRNIYPCVIDKVADKVKEWPIYRVTKASGAGYFQLANVNVIREKHDGLYVDPNKCRDIPEFEQYHKTRSDIQFRKRLGGITKIETKPQYHLNHERDNEFGKHLTIQR